MLKTEFLPIYALFIFHSVYFLFSFNSLHKQYFPVSLCYTNPKVILIYIFYNFHPNWIFSAEFTDEILFFMTENSFIFIYS